MSMTVLFVNTRPTPLESEPCFRAARALGLDVVLLADRAPPAADGSWQELVNVDTGGTVVRRVERSDRHYPGRAGDTLPDLFLEWNHNRPVETIWSSRLGMLHSPYEHWRTGDHRPGACGDRLAGRSMLALLRRYLSS